MRPQDVLHIMQSTAPAATIEDAEAFLGLCEQRGLTPFMEASPLVMDYTKQNGEHVHTIGIKEHYAVAERWAQQSGGYTIRVRDVRKEKNGDIVARIGIVSNRDYAAVGKMCATIPGINFKEELSGFIVYGDAIIDAKEMQRRSPPKSKTWEWIAEKRARESAITQKFGKEPSQSRQLYTNAVAAISMEDATAALFPAPQKREALPAPEVIEGDYTDYQGVDLQDQTEQEEETEEETYIIAIEFGVFDVKAKGRLHIGFMANNEKWPSVRWWKGRDALIESAPWIGQIATKDELAQVDRRWTYPMKVYYETDDKGYKIATRFELLEAEQ